MNSSFKMYVRDTIREMHVKGETQRTITIRRLGTLSPYNQLSYLSPPLDVPKSRIETVNGRHTTHFRQIIQSWSQRSRLLSWMKHSNDTTDLFNNRQLINLIMDCTTDDSPSTIVIKRKMQTNVNSFHSKCNNSWKVCFCVDSRSRS